jgi:ATP-dependent Clp protease protease subunit
MNLQKEFRNYGVKHLGISGTTIDAVTAHQVEASMTPYILEERQLNVTQIDVFSRLMKDRILFLNGVVEDRMSSVVTAQMLFLSSLDAKSDITFYVDSPGGSVKSGLTIVDVMNYIPCDTATVNTGMAASMGSVLLSSGTKGKRASLIHAKVMTHMVSHGTQGNLQDTRINQLEAEKYNYILFKMLARNCDKTFEEMLESSRRDRWFNSEEALKFGLIDEIIGIDKNQSIDKELEGFAEYYNKEVFSLSFS